jgi:hypothetical protein
MCSKLAVMRSACGAAARARAKRTRLKERAGVRELILGALGGAFKPRRAAREQAHGMISACNRNNVPCVRACTKSFGFVDSSTAV